RTFVLLGAYGVTLIALRTLSRGEPVRLKALSFFFVLHLLLVPIVAALNVIGSDAADDVRLACRMLAAVAGVGIGGSLLFNLVLPRLHVDTPRILQDVVVAITSVAAVLAIASRHGFDITGVVATSAVLTAILGFSLQDSLGNVAGGLSLQLEGNLEIGDWVKIGDINGRITEIGWRSISVETRNWETAVIPNSVVTRSTVVVLGRRTGKPQLWRRWVYFNVDFRFQPSDVIEVVQEALHAAAIENVAREPRPNCVLMDLHDSYGRYAVRYFLSDLAVDDPTDSAVRTCVYFALKRAGIPLSMPAHALFVTEESSDRKQQKVNEDLGRRMTALAKVELFSQLTEEDRAQLARSMRYAPFTSGETVTRQGARANWLYLIVEGKVSVRVTGDGGLEKEVAQLGAGSFFGEMSLLTGEPRAATVVALSDVECFRLDKDAFQTLLLKRPELAEHVADELTRRRSELLAGGDGARAQGTKRRTTPRQ
ncbi:MAG: cyclic nucleotide-binding domain-containing protein, partial [Myxococcales bacterium]